MESLSFALTENSSILSILKFSLKLLDGRYATFVTMATRRRLHICLGKLLSVQTINRYVNEIFYMKTETAENLNQ